MIARDQRALLRRVANIYPGPGGGMDPSPGGGGYSGPGGGKYIGPSHYADGGGVDDYGGEHRPPGPEDGAPLHDLTGQGRVYPDDIYGPNAARYYGHGDEPLDHGTMSIIRQFKGRPSAKAAIYRAVPAGITTAEKLADLEKAMAANMRRGVVPEGESRELQGSVWYNKALAERARLRALPPEPETKTDINPGDWVTINRQYAKNHGESALRGKYKIVRKTVRADELYTDGNSIHEYGYWPRTQRADGGSVPPFKLYSGAAKVIGAKGQAKATPQQYAAMPGIKPDELKYSNFDTLGSKALPREEVIKHLEANRLPIEETQLGGEGRNTSTKFHGPKTTLPGGKNYREVLLHLLPKTGHDPESLSINDVARGHTIDAQGNRTPIDLSPANANYKSSHWDEPNVLAHVRMSDRRGPNGEKVLHVEEIQSDWGQQGRDQGFGRREGKVEQQPGGFWRITWPDGTFSGGYDTQTSAETALEYRGKGVPHGPYVDNTQKWTDLALKRVLHEAAHGGYDKIAFTPGDEQNKRYSLATHVKELRLHDNSSGGIGRPRMEGPFEGGSLDVYSHDGSTKTVYVRDAAHLSEQVGKEAAERLLAQEPKSVSVAGLGMRQRALGGQGLMMGGAGMRGYYDNILPKRLQALAQQHDPQAKVRLFGHKVAADKYKGYDRYEVAPGPIADHAVYGVRPDGNRVLVNQNQPTREAAEAHASELNDAAHEGVPVHSLDVTPQMRDSIKANGFNSFKRGGDVGMRQRYADGGETDTPAMNKALDLVSMFQPAKPMMAQRVAPQQGGQMIEPGSVSIKSLTESFDKAIQHHTSLGPEERAANSRAALQTIAPHLGKSKTGVPSPLLTKNAKLMKSEEGYKGGAPISLPNGQGVETTGLALAPAYQEGKFTTCPNSASCKKECLGKFAGGYFYAGGGQDPDALKGPRLNSVRKTVAMLREPEAFAVRLHDEIEAAKRMASMNNNMLGVRLNVLSDINPRVHKSIFEAHPDVAFYDYTKNNTNPVAPNHHYTYSSTGVSDSDVDNPHSNWKQMRKRLDTGSNVAMAFSHKAHLPETVFDEETGKRYKVTNGDSHDFRPLDIQQKDQPGVIVGLRNKKISSTNAAAHRTSNGFFVRYNPDFLVGNEGKRAKDMHGNPIAQNTEVRIRHQKAAPTLKSNDEAETP